MFEAFKNIKKENSEVYKDLLLKDICTRLPNKIKGVLSYDKDKEIFTIEGCEIEKGILYLSNSEGCYVDDFKPFLRSMSIMDEKETNEYNEQIDKDTIQMWKVFEMPNACMIGLNALDWLNDNYFDYRGLIEKGLAIEAPEGMYNIKTE